MSLASVSTRQEAIEVLEGYSEARKEELDQRRTRRPLVKSYMLETVAHDNGSPSLESIFGMVGHSLIRLDETLFKIRDDKQSKTVGLLEKLLPRHPVVYSFEDAKEMDPWIRRLVHSSPALDNLWLSGRAFEELLKAVIRFAPGHRYGRLVFEHTNIFEVDASADQIRDGEPEDEYDTGSDTEEPSQDEGDDFVPERRTTKFSVVDRLDVLKEKLPRMRDIYTPLHAIAQLRFPARGPGGHDFYYHGKATNRSNSFTDHRQHIQFVLRIYKRATEETERTAWQGVERTKITTGGQENFVVGAPVRLVFSERLSQGTFDKFITSTFKRKTNKFRLWGNPIVLGPRKVHVYGMDRHLWQPLFLEITDQHIVAIVPQGTCGNSIHRLVTNVQQFLDAGVEVWVGDRKYSDLIQVEPSIWSIYEH